MIQWMSSRSAADSDCSDFPCTTQKLFLTRLTPASMKFTKFVLQRQVVPVENNLMGNCRCYPLPPKTSFEDAWESKPFRVPLVRLSREGKESWRTHVTYWPLRLSFFENLSPFHWTCLIQFFLSLARFPATKSPRRFPIVPTPVCLSCVWLCVSSSDLWLWVSSPRTVCWVFWKGVP